MEQEIMQNENENIVKITVTGQAGQILSNLVNQANEGFVGGKINRQDLASFIIEKFYNNHSDADLNELRQLHYDDASMLEAVYRKMKETGQVPDFLKDALRKQFQVPDELPKKAKKQLSKKYISDVLKQNEEVA